MAKPKNRPICPDCGRPKMIFESESKAKNFIKFNADSLDYGGEKLRTYYCPACCGWHISHKKYHKGMEGHTDELIKRYNNDKKHVRPIDIENADKLYNILNEHNFNSRNEVNEFLKQFGYDMYNVYARQEAKTKYYKEKNL